MSRSEHENLVNEVLANGRRIERLESRLDELVRGVAALKVALQELVRRAHIQDRDPS